MNILYNKIMERKYYTIEEVLEKIGYIISKQTLYSWLKKYDDIKYLKIKKPPKAKNRSGILIDLESFYNFLEKNYGMNQESKKTEQKRKVIVKQIVGEPDTKIKEKDTKFVDNNETQHQLEEIKTSENEDNFVVVKETDKYTVIKKIDGTFEIKYK